MGPLCSYRRLPNHSNPEPGRVLFQEGLQHCAEGSSYFISGKAGPIRLLSLMDFITLGIPLLVILSIAPMY